MTIHEEHLARVKVLEDRYKVDLKKLEDRLKEEQTQCKHKFERYENLFYALGETYPGNLCKSFSQRI